MSGSTARLILAPLRVQDAAELFDVRGDAEAMRYWDWAPDADVAATRAMVADIRADMAAGRAMAWTARTHEGRFVGLFDLSGLDGDAPDIGFMVLRGLWARGYAHEASEWVIAQAQAMAILRLHARIHAGNVASAALLARLGFVETGGVTAHDVAPGRMIDCRYFVRDLATIERAVVK